MMFVLVVSAICIVWLTFSVAVPQVLRNCARLTRSWFSLASLWKKAWYADPGSELGGLLGEQPQHLPTDSAAP